MRFDLDSIPIRLYTYLHLPHARGVLQDASGTRRRGWRPRAGLVTPHPGGPGSPSGPTTGVCLQWLDAAGTKGGESGPAQGRHEPSVPARKLRSRGQKSPQVERRKATRPRRARQVCTNCAGWSARGAPAERQRLKSGWRLSVLHPLAVFFSEGCAKPGAASGARQCFPSPAASRNEYRPDSET